MTLLPEKITIGSRQSRLAKTQVEIFIKHFSFLSKIEIKMKIYENIDKVIYRFNSFALN